MEPYENDDFLNSPPSPPVPEEPEVPYPPYEAQPQYNPQPQQSAYHGTGAGRKESPYANSPYVMNQRNSYQEYHYQPQTEPPKKPKKIKKARKPIWKGILVAVLAIALVAGGCLTTAYCVNEYWEERTEDTVEMLTDKIEALEKQIDTASSGNGISASIPANGSAMTPSQLYSYSVDSVVAISTTVQATGYFGEVSEGTASGSGFILTEDGYVVTNYHVVEGATAIDVILHDDTEYPAELIGQDATNDIAVLKVEASGLPAASLGSSSALNIGDMVAAIGNPLGELASTQTIGYVSGINREVTTDNTIISMIQTDAAINPGNSGGPLFNMYGQVIGITTAKYSGTTGSGASIEGIGFAIPIDDVMPIISDLMEYGYVTGAYMGVTVQNTDAESASMFGLPTGAYIISVEKGGAADRAGVQPKDIVIGLGEHKVGNITDLTRALRNFKAGDTTIITLIRSGQEMTLEITLDEKPHETETPAPQPDSQMPSDGNYEEWYDYFRRYFGD